MQPNRHDDSECLCLLLVPFGRPHKYAVGFYRRPLPEPAVAFSGSEGQQIFSEALVQGYTKCYFGLAENFTTQDEPVLVAQVLTFVLTGVLWSGNSRNGT